MAEARMRAPFIAVAALLAVVAATVTGGLASEQCSVGVVVNDLRFLGTSGLGSLELELSYPTPEVAFVGSGADVACEPIPDGAGDRMEFSDDDVGTLAVSFASETGVPGLLTPLMRCTAVAQTEPSPGDFQVAVTDARAPGGAALDFEPNVFVNDDIVCTPVTTTTTMPEPAACSDPYEPHGSVTAPDCLFILRVALDLSICPQPCVCAPGGVLPASATDALICLREATGQDVTLDCPCQ